MSLVQLPKGGLTMEERYDMELLSKFVETSSLEVCLQACKKNIDAVWWLHKSYSSLTKDWKWDSETTVSLFLAIPFIFFRISFWSTILSVTFFVLWNVYQWQCFKVFSMDAKWELPWAQSEITMGFQLCNQSHDTIL